MKVIWLSCEDCACQVEVQHCEACDQYWDKR